MKTKLSLIIFILSALFYSSAEAKAVCTCGYVSPNSSFVDAVFVGTVTKKSKERGPSLLTVQVSEIFKGLDNETTVEIFHKDMNCGSTMFENKEYLFLASRDKITGKLSMGPCNLSYKNSSHQKQMIEILRWQKNPQRQGGMLIGRVSQFDKKETIKPNGIDKVFAENEKGQKFEAEIASDGIYKFTNLMVGTYKVFITLPKNLTTYGDAKGYDWETSVRANVKISKGQGTIEDFSVQSNNKISGKVFNSNGTPAVKRQIHLINPNSYEDVSTETDKFGFYEFKGVSDGKYLLMVGVKNNYVSPFWKEAVQPTTYYPNSTSRKDAEIIELTDGNIIENKFITLFPMLKPSILNGKILLPNGNVAKKAEIYIQIRRKETDRTLHSGWSKIASTNSDGKFSFDIYDSIKYLTKIKLEKNENLYTADCFLISPEDRLKPLEKKLKKGEVECDEEKFGF